MHKFHTEEFSWGRKYIYLDDGHYMARQLLHGDTQTNKQTDRQMDNAVAESPCSEGFTNFTTSQRAQ